MPKKPATKKLTKKESNAITIDYEIQSSIAKLAHPKKRAFLSVLYATNGNVTRACKAALIARRTYYYWLESDQEFQDLANNQLQQMLDEAHQKLVDSAMSKNGTTELIFFLKSRHPDYRPQKKTVAMQDDKGTKFILTRG